MADAIRSASGWDLGLWQQFSGCLYYRTVNYSDARSVTDLAHSLRVLETRHPTGGNRIIYLALPPVLYQTAARHLGQAGLSAENREGNGWARIVLEKPFGTDLETSRLLDQSLHEHFREHQIFRIDHYLAKETVQNILMFRFANSIFEPIWNRRYIDYVSISAAETLGVEHRSGYYESAGVLRDMFQNHMMQLLSLTAMEPPPRFEAELVRDEKTKVFSALRPFPVGSIEEHLVLGQYAAGFVGGRPVPAYREEEGVDFALFDAHLCRDEGSLGQLALAGSALFHQLRQALVTQAHRNRDPVQTGAAFHVPKHAGRADSGQPTGPGHLPGGAYHPDLPNQEPGPPCACAP